MYVQTTSTRQPIGGQYDQSQMEDVASLGLFFVLFAFVIIGIICNIEGRD